MTHPEIVSPTPIVTVNIRLVSLVDLDGLRYIGGVVPSPVVDRYLEALGRHVGLDRLAELTACKARRDGANSHHVTVASPPVLRESVEDIWVDIVQSAEVVPLHLYGIGSVSNDEAVTYYIIADSPTIQTLRARTGLPPVTLHVTLGFSPHDIYDRQKDQRTHIIAIG